MRRYSYLDYTTDPSLDSCVVVVSEDDIRRDFYPYWYERMCKKFGKETVDAKYSFEHCLDDWIIVNWAWESLTGAGSSLRGVE